MLAEKLMPIMRKAAVFRVMAGTGFSKGSDSPYVTFGTAVAPTAIAEFIRNPALADLVEMFNVSVMAAYRFIMA
jgi:hypothetical protein